MTINTINEIKKEAKHENYEICYISVNEHCFYKY
jgi:hypothetical protein